MSAPGLKGHDHHWFCAGCSAERLDDPVQKLDAIRELHQPGWWNNCINACCSGEDCKHRYRLCVVDDEEWPCPTVAILDGTPKLHELRQAVLAMAISLGAALPNTREVISSLDALVDTWYNPPAVGTEGKQ